jgi:hypothetical protein
MADYKEIFAKNGYSLHETESLEAAIVDALKEHRMRYLYGIPILLENRKIDFAMLLKIAAKEKVLKELKEVLFISSQVVSDRKTAARLRPMAKGIKKTTLDVEEFKKAYEDYMLAKGQVGFSPSLSFHLSFLFAKRQIDILYKLKSGERLTKTEKEYFSRTIKKKLIAIRELSQLAKDILGDG